MKHLLLTTIAAVLLVTTAFADPIHTAAINGDLVGVQAELDKGVDVNAKDEFGSTPLLHAAATFQKEIVELLVNNDADVNAADVFSMTPLHFAALEGRKEIVELLIAKGADVNVKTEDGLTPLDRAIKYQRTETADLLRKHGGKTAEELKAEGK